jgi:hypothetical protein
LAASGRTFFEDFGVSGFSAAWLALRAAADAGARNRKLARCFAASLPKNAVVVDLGAGTGALMRWFAPQMPTARWLLVDGDAALLAQAPSRARKQRQSLLARLPRADGYASSALIDLAGTAWLQRLVAAARGKPLMMFLAVDGRHVFDPPHAQDVAVFSAFARHQQRNKGLGFALGGRSPAALARIARHAGYRVQLAASDWHLRDSAMLESMVEGLADAASEADPSLDLLAWKRLRRAQIVSGKLTLLVGHLDLLATRHRYRRTPHRA